jgi:hypothetical protein
MRRLTRLRTLLGMSTLVAAACLDVTNPPSADTEIRIINASAVPLNILLDGNQTINAASPADVSVLDVIAGPHHLQFQATGGSSSALDVTTVSGEIVETYVVSPSSTTLASAVLDTGSIVPTGKSKIRVLHLSQKVGPIDIWRTQPDFHTATRIQFPFPYLATTPFVQSDSGFWEVFITPESAGPGNVLLSTGQFHVESTGRRTIVLMDSANTQIFRILPE